MRYHYQKPKNYTVIHGQSYRCDHPVYSRCTLFKKNDKGLAVIQQRYDPYSKKTWWNEIDLWLNDEIANHPLFPGYFDDRAGVIGEDGLYPTVTVRQVMWGLRMKPLKRELWETVFDRKDI